MVKSVVEKEKSAMKDRLKVLHVALERGNYELAAHALVYGMVKASIEMKNISGNGVNPGSPCNPQKVSRSPEYREEASDRRISWHGKKAA